LTAKHERKVVRDLLRFIDNGDVLVKRWRMASHITAFVGFALIGFAIFGAPRSPSLPWLFPLLAALGGVSVGLGIWFATFTGQWPITRKFIDAELVRKRARELDQDGA
jgi:hypothetical protein